eukprot:CAMPEP_0117493102 /NCGR_PEP_ID=MMETSP0784-20121206/18926_1 /TAXON_ID=39447 /ORGANISM="" /LENGTH=71 /DNA_ID=CAMNT_0005287947 /DNA_START=354 /DNA_END=570 /DNA_ORIENTATION=+
MTPLQRVILIPPRWLKLSVHSAQNQGLTAASSSSRKPGVDERVAAAVPPNTSEDQAKATEKDTDGCVPTPA